MLTGTARAERQGLSTDSVITMSLYGPPRPSWACTSTRYSPRSAGSKTLARVGLWSEQVAL